MSSILNVFSTDPLMHTRYGEGLEVLTVVALLGLRIARDLALGSDNPKIRHFAEVADIGASPLLLVFLGLVVSKLMAVLGLTG
ncbi:hypothetical protein Marky_1662 [Marinithermus hydrothermalis DSM 14884]|uniref:Uncharacterized protein n=1 Tax=Marinithermus hydrothermalis (strain DSM 14884 / JCM 11576 / T1) TaxID=869210 RepID=F2NKE8_MARHT|nr:hypothetical protein Marky_1662 [Marinithermus hydrothermalis DSM 14884]